jgi:hypothetical protein
VSKQKQATLLILACVALLATWAAAFAQSDKNASRQTPQDEENSRSFWPPNFRPKAAAPKPKPRTGSYKRVTPPATTNPIETAEQTSMGVTIWLLRAATEVKQTQTETPAPAPTEQSRGSQPQSTDEIARILVRKKNGQRAEMVAERVEANTPFNVGQQLRLSIEVPRDGYLYVIDREQYADGTLSEPYLIFPSNPQSNEHRVTQGRIVEIPTGEDAVFEVQQFNDNGKKLTGEALTFLVSPRPLEGLPRPQADGGPIPLPKAQVEQWESKWGTQVEQLELQNGAGKYRTRSEQQATTNPNQKLTQDDPLPQTVFHVAAKPGNPFLVKLPLKIGQ